jgi:hypothetical protein
MEVQSMIDGRYGKEVDVLSYSMDKCMYFYRRLIRVGDQYGGVELEWLAIRGIYTDDSAQYIKLNIFTTRF